MSSYYDVLGVNPSATEDEIRSAYLRKIRLVGPGSITSGLNRAFAEIQKAYDTLSDPDNRDAYDHKYQTEHGGNHTLRVNDDSKNGFKPELAGKVVVDASRLPWYAPEPASTELSVMTRLNTDMGLLKRLSQREAGAVNSGISDARRVWSGEQIALLSRKFLSINGARIFWSVKPGHEESADAIVVVGKHAIVVWGRAQQPGKYALNPATGMVSRGYEEVFSLQSYASVVEKVRSLVRLDEVMGFVVMLPANQDGIIEASDNTPDVRMVNAQGFVNEAGAFLAHQTGAVYPKKFASLYDKV